MKKNTFAKILAFALTACALPVAALAGDIYEILPLEGSRGSSDALQAGEKFKFLIRLLANDPAESDETNAWRCVFVGGGSEELAAQTPPKMGLAISGRMRFADIVSCETNAQYGAIFTDIVCEYQVQPGDFALPVRPALYGSTESAPIVPGVDGGSASALGYFLQNVQGIDPSSGLWAFKDLKGNVAKFSFCSDNLNNRLSFAKGKRSNVRVQDIDLTEASFYVKSIDFDANYDNPPYWRDIPEGEAVSATIETIGISDTNSTPTFSTTLYVWSEDDTSVSLDESEAQWMWLKFPNDTPGLAPISRKTLVKPIKLLTGVTSYNFKLLGVTKETTTRLVLAASTNYNYATDGVNVLVTNFTTRAVSCKKSTPSVKLSWDAAGLTSGVYGETVQAFTNDLSEISAQGITLYVKPSKAFSEEVKLNLKAKLAGDGEDYAFVWTNALLGAKVDSMDSFSVPPVETNITIQANDTSVHKIYLYPIGGIQSTRNPGVTFSLAFAADTPAAIVDEYELKTTCTLKFTDAKPSILQPTTETILTGDVKAGVTIPVEVRDTYRDLTEPRTYKVDVTYSDGGSYTTNAVAFRRDVVTKISATGFGQKATWVRVKVTDEFGNTALSDNIPMTVPAAKTISAELVTTKSSTAEAEDDLTFAEGESRFLRFVLGPDETAANTTDLYAFLLPLNEASSNLVSLTDKWALETGLLIQGNQLVSKNLAEITFQDGCSESANLQFDIVVREGDKLTDKVVTTYQSQKLYLAVTNVMASVAGVNVNGSPDSIAPGETFTDALAADKEIPFEASVLEPSTVDVASNIVAIWCFTDGRNANQYKYEIVTSATEAVSCKHKFKTSGVVQTVQLIALDKDMLKSYGDGKPLTLASAKTLWTAMLKRVTPYKFYVNIAEALHIEVTAKYDKYETESDELMFTEGENTGKLVIRLSAPAEEDMELTVTLESLNETHDEGYLTFYDDSDTITLDIEEGETEPTTTTSYNGGLKFKYDKVDGTAGSTDDRWYVTVKAPDDLDTTYKDGTAYVRVLNKAPVISGGSTYTNTQMALNQAFELKWSAKDVAPDLTAGLNYKFTLNDAEIGGNDTEGRPYSGKITDSLVHTNSFKLTQEGLNILSLIVTDKEGEAYDNQDQVFWYYYISPTKRLEVRAFGPSDTTKSKYGKAAGLGQGRVWANGISGTAENFLQNWTYGIKQAEAEVHAYGYPSAASAYEDDGNLKDAAGISLRDLKLDINGLNPTASSLFSYDGKYDNYFYRWVYLDSTEGSTSDTVTYGNPQPTKVANYDTKETVTLTAYDEKKESYETTRMEAVFSREYLAEDNLGDINGDGIPDLLTDKVGVMDENGVVDGDDLTKQDSYNEDADYLPNTDSAKYAALIPGLAETWVTEGRPFTAKLEIRGYGEGLNDALSISGSGIEIKNHRDEANILTTFTEAESNAWVKAGSPVDANGKPDLTKWSPERPSDPTLEDTDGDGFTDGYEYYFWYLAHVGYMEQGTNGLVHTFLEGKRYNPYDPAHPYVITHEEIEKLFDPISSAGEDVADTRDTDDDGIPDLVEFAIGTNPILFDTDGDGLPDGYEILIDGGEDSYAAGSSVTLDPLLYSTDGSTCDADLNATLDNDAKAECPIKDCYIVPYLDEDGVTTNYLGVLEPAKIGEREDGSKALTNAVSFEIWEYGNERKLVLGKEHHLSATNFTVVGAAVKTNLVALHYHVYQLKGFDPRTAWSPVYQDYGITYSSNKIVNTTPYTVEDEYLLMTFFLRDGVLDEKNVIPSRTRDRLAIWQEYTTDPCNADGDADGVPDGWELYIMAGPKTLQTDVKKADYSERIISSYYGPAGVYGPFVDFNELPDVLRGQDLGQPETTGDGLTEPEEFSGIASVKAYANCSTITLLKPLWRNKTMPTDPWNKDTDGDGLMDGEEYDYFIYGSSEATGMAGGGLNPLSWDTDYDGLPDPWEAEFAGTFGGGETSTSTVVSEDGSTTNSVTSTSAVTWNNDGMDGTVADDMKDYDFDGLVNWQEYFVGTLRHFRYDDSVSQFGHHTLSIDEIPSVEDEEAWGEFWYKRLVDDGSESAAINELYNPHFIGAASGTAFDAATPYFSICTNAWEDTRVYGKWYYFKDGVYHDLLTPPADKYWIPYKGADGAKQYNRFTYRAQITWGALSPYATSFSSTPSQVAPLKYISCDPRDFDTDRDGMDDYYELFHGLNPLLGHSGVDGSITPESPRDVVYEAYANGDRLIRAAAAHAENNWWTNGNAFQAPRLKTEKKGGASSLYDFVCYPWLAGLAVADPDGDDIRNQKEAILPNMQASGTYMHTDPTPLWMTDTSDASSFVRRYYNLEPVTSLLPIELLAVPTNVFTYGGVTYKIDDFPWLTWNSKTGVLSSSFDNNRWQVASYIYNFEENEGFDSDHDYLSDSREALGRSKSASDPQQHDEPIRRQAMWFNGTDAFLETPPEESETLPYTKSSAEPRETLLYYTVEAWVKADAETYKKANARQVIVERSLYTGEAGPADTTYVRKNFQLAINNGRWYTAYDSSGTSSERIEITEGPEASTNWTHLAATYDGKNLILYVNGIARVTKLVGREPEHGLAAASTDKTGGIDINSQTWSTSAYLVGASAKDYVAHVVDYLWRTSFAYPQLEDYGDFFKGYVDEVRVWDGARAASDILADYTARTRYTSALALENRDNVYARWVNGARRSPSSETTLPPQLLHHWAFDHIAGAVDPADLIQVPAGFSVAPSVENAKARWVRPENWVCPWWNSFTLKSSIYTDCAWVPWICDTVAHLPRLDQTTVDSVYWSGNYAGNASAASNTTSGVFAFARTAEVYSKWSQMLYSKNVGTVNSPYIQPTRWDLIESLDGSDNSLQNQYKFTIRNRNRTGDDLLPMGGAYPRRISATEGGLWDELGAADAWAEVGEDGDDNGLPDWWEEFAVAHWGVESGTVLTWDTLLKRYDIEMTAGEAYLRDIADGLLPDWEFHEEYADTRDADGDGMPDWWEDLYGIDTGSTSDALADSDHDGLSNYQEYLIAERDGLYQLNPTLAQTYEGQDETDYFLKTSDGRYLGEVYADHDFLEDLDEGDLGTDHTLYDAYSDHDEDGWTAFAEQRYSKFKMGISARFVSHMVGDEEMTDSPIPVVHATLRYNGETTSNATIFVEAYSGNNLQKEPTATYAFTPGSAQTRYLNLGSYEDRVIHGTLAPGHIRAGEDQIKLQFFFIQNDTEFSWSVSNATTVGSFTGTYAEMTAAMAQYGSSFVLSSQAAGWNDLTVGSLIAYSDSAQQILQIAVNENKQTGKLLLAGQEAGAIDLVTGDFDLDLSSIGTIYQMDTAIRQSQCFYRLEYQSILPTQQTKALEVSLAKPDEGALTEGATAFVAYMDKDNNGAYTPAVDPIGFVKDVQVGWDNVPELVIEMTDNSQAAFVPFSYADSDEMIRIVRTSINGKTENVKHRIVYSRNHALSTTTSRRLVYDADILTSATFGLDWANLASDIAAMDGLSESDVTSVGYTVVRGTSSIQNIPDDSIITNFTVSYTATQTKPVAYSPSESAMPTVETQQPTFKWTLPEGYTAFQLRISDATGKLVYQSAQQKMPPRDGSQRYVWTPPVYIGAISSTNDAWQLANNSNYTWSVAAFNPKFTKAEWSEKAAFKTRLAEENDLSTVYGSAKVRVQYFGPATNGLGDVIVELYKTADCTGTPAARTRLVDTDGVVTSLTNAQEVVFHGLADGDYYAAAFIDRNGDCTRQRYETWGYSAQVGLGFAEIWTPLAVSVDASSTVISSVSLYLEDTDVNQNDVLDVFDDEKILQAADSSEAETLAATDTDGDGMPDKWEEENGLNPYDASDADYAIDGDKMAYVDLAVCLVQIGASDGSEAQWYALTDYEHEPAKIKNGLFQPQTSATNLLKVATTWKNGSAYGLGTNVTFKASDVILDSKLATVRLVHAQVFAYRGFNSKTAVDVDDAVDTKSFTALDKYLVGSYFAAIGVADFQDKHLDPNKIDSDDDGLADGWELYVMYGKGWSEMLGGVTKAQSQTISPFVKEDALKVAPGANSKLKLYEEYDAGYLPTDPWNVDTDGDTVIDYYAYYYHLKGDEAAEDADGDGLSNYAEYLSSCVFANFPKCDPDKYATSEGVCDYYKKVGELYLGEIFMDHDQVDDAWERAYATGANMYVHDPLRDDDGDGWSNYAEAKVGTDPTLVYSPSIETNLAEYPVPIVAARVTYAGKQSLAGATLYFKAWNEKTDAHMTGVPDAVWSTADNAASVKYLGKNPGVSMTYTAGPGTLTPGSVVVSVRDTQCAKVVDGTTTTLPAEVSKWYGIIRDSYTDGSKGTLYTIASTNETLAAQQPSVTVGSVDYATGLVTLDYTKLLSTFLVTYGSGTGGTDGTAEPTTETLVQLNLANSFFKLSWTPSAVVASGNATYYLSDSTEASSTSKGHLREGLNSFLVWADLEGGNEGAYDPGEPLGFAQHVDVGWQGASFAVTLSEMSAITPRMGIWTDSATNDRGQTIDKMTETMLTDRLGDPDETLQDLIIGDVAESGATARLRFVRMGINGVYANALGCGTVSTRSDGPYDPLVFERTYQANGRDFLCEADFLQDGELDLDWSGLKSKVCDYFYVQKGVGEVTNMTYLAVLDGGTGNEYWFAAGNASSNTTILALSTTIERRFECIKHAPVAENMAGIVYTARPTFRWSLPNEEAYAKKYGSSYTAFKLKIFASDGTKVYDSGVRRAPAEGADGVFSWTADVSAGDLTKAGEVFSATGDYTWQVAMYNAKFQPTADELKWQKLDKPSEPAAFSLAVNAQQAMNDHQYSSIDVAVKYAGPATNLAWVSNLASLNGKVRVQAFATADFSGEALSEAVATDEVASFTNLMANATLIGLSATGTYYLRAYLDSNGNHARDAWESYGASKPVTLSTSLVKAPIATIWIEDCDLDQDWLPDAWEYVMFGDVASTNASVAADGTIVFTTDAKTAATKNLASFSTGLEGASLTIFENGSFAKTLLGWGDDVSVTFDDIRAAVQQELAVKAETFKITSLTLGSDGKVTLTVDAEVAPSIAGELLSNVYSVTAGAKKVTLKVYRKTSLAQAGWGEAVTTKTVEIGQNVAEVQVDVGVTADDLKSGFYKIDIVE